MTAAWSWVASACLVLLISGLLFKLPALLALGFPFLVFTVAPLWRPLPASRWSAERRLGRQRLPAGQACTVEVRLENAGGDLAEVLVSECLPPGVSPQGQTSRRGDCPAGKALGLCYEFRGHRGRYEFSGLTVEVMDPLGLKRRKEWVPCPAPLTVLPAAPPLGPLSISPRRTRIYAGLIRSRESGSGTEFLGTRPSVPGDPPRHINWKASARWGTLITNLFEQERIADVGLVLDARKAVEVQNGENSLFEFSIEAVAGLARHFLRCGNRVGLLIYGSYIHWTLPGYGRGQEERVLTALAGAELGDHAVFQEFQYLPSRLFPPESQVVLVSPLRREDVPPLQRLRVLGYRVLVVSPDPVSFEKKSSPAGRLRDAAERLARLERNVLLARLRRSGVQVIDWDVNLPLPVAMARAMPGRRK